MSRRTIRWLLTGLAVLLLAGGVLRVLSARKEQRGAVAQAVAQKAQALVELAPGDVVKAQQRDLAQGLPVSGSLRAVN
ncbi:MAG: efflux transporter periplasmic adaptor subunit, partial [Ramlibacter sp.]|nr:efflux transporter periplasmic adaptor subunit [Ramlibacter sp.]